MRGFWNQTSGANRLIMLAVSVAIVIIVVGGMLFASSHLAKSAPKAVSEDNENVDLTAPPTTATNARPLLNTTTTLLNGMTRTQIEQPESNILNETQLAYIHNQANSRLSTKAYAKSVEIAQKFALASATGEGEAAFQDYFAQLPNDPWVSNYKLVYATAMTTDDPTIIKAKVWFTGTEKASGLPMLQVTHGFFLTRPTANSLDLRPLFLVDPTDDPDYGVDIHG